MKSSFSFISLLVFTLACSGRGGSSSSSSTYSASSTKANLISTRGIAAVDSAKNSSRAPFVGFVKNLNAHAKAAFAASVSNESTACNNQGGYITSGTDSDLATVASSDKHGEHIWCAMTVDSANPERFKGMLSKNLAIACALDVALGGFTYATTDTVHTGVSITLDSNNDCVNANMLANSDLEGTYAITVREKDVSAATGSQWDYQIEIDLDGDGSYEQNMFLKDGATDGVWGVKDVELSGSTVTSLAEVILDTTNSKAMFFSGETTDGNERSNRLYVDGSISSVTGEFSSVDTATLILSTDATSSLKAISMNYTSSGTEAYETRVSTTDTAWSSNAGSIIDISTIESNLQHASGDLDTYNSVDQQLDFTSTEVGAAVSTLY